MFPILSAFGGEPELHTFQKTTILMDTLVAITVVSDDEQKANEAIDAAFDTVREIEHAISFWTKDSEIAAMGKMAGVAPVKVSPITLDLVEASLMIAGKTGGGFDPTVGTLMRLWDFKKGIMPTDAQIREKLPVVGYKMVEVNKSASTVYLKKKGMAFDTGGIAKGFAADRAVETLKAHGMKGGLVAVGGDIMAFGRKADNTVWRVGIRNPRPKGKDDDVMAIIDLDNSGISTAGDYERFMIKDGKRYHHIMDPKTGHPADKGFISVSIIAPHDTLSDGFDDGIFVQGPKVGIETVKREGLGCVAVLDNGTVYVTDDILHNIEWKNVPAVSP